DLLGLDVRGEPRPSWRRAPGLRHLVDRLQRPRPDHRQRTAGSGEGCAAAAGRKTSAAAEAGGAAPAGTATAAAIPAAAATGSSTTASAAAAAGWTVWRFVRELIAKNVARMVRSAIRDSLPVVRPIPDFAALHPGYGLRAIIPSASSPVTFVGNRIKS